MRSSGPLRLWRWLTEPIARVTDPVDRKKSRFIASLFVGLLPVGLLVAALPPALFDDRPLTADNDFVVLVMACIAWIAPYTLARRGRHAAATLLACGVSSIAVLAIVVTDGLAEDLYYLVLPTALSSVVVSVPVTAWYVAGTLVAAALIPFVGSGIPDRWGYYTGPYAFVVLGSLLLLLMVNLLNNLARDQRSRLVDHSTSLEHQTEELQRVHAFLTALSTVAGHLGSAPDPAGVMHTMGQELRKLGLKSIVTQLEPDRQAFTVEYTSIDSKLLRAGEKLAGMSLVGYRVPRTRLSIWDKLIEEAEPHYTTDSLPFMSSAVPGVAAETMRTLVRLGGSRVTNRLAWLPLKAQETTIGALLVWGPDLREEDLEALQVFAGQVASSLESARLYAAARERAQELEAFSLRLSTELADRQRAEDGLQWYAARLRILLRISQDIIGAATPLHIAQSALDQLSNLPRPLTSAVIPLDFDRGVARILAVSSNVDLPMLQVGAELPLDQVTEGQCLAVTMRDGELQYLPDLDEVPDLSPFLQGIREASGLRSLILAPLLIGDRPGGMLAIGSRLVDAFDPGRLETARAIADALAVGIQQSRLREELRDYTDRLELAVSEKDALLKEKDALLREIHHRVKNNLQITSSLLNLQASHLTDPAAIEMLQASRSRVQSMALVHEQLYQSGDLAEVDLGDYVDQLAGYLYHAYNAHAAGVRLRTDVERMSLDIERAVPCGLIINELLTNALKHAFPGDTRGTISVSLHHHDPLVELKVTDDGVGLPDDVDIETAQTMGLQLVESLVRQLRGDLQITSDGGTAFAITFNREADAA